MKKLIIFIFFIITMFLGIKNIYAKIDIGNEKYKIDAVKFINEPQYEGSIGSKKFLYESIEIKISEIEYITEQITNKTRKIKKVAEELEKLNEYKKKLNADLRNYITFNRDFL